MTLWRLLLALTLLLLTSCNAFYFRHKHWLKQFPEAEFPSARKSLPPPPMPDRYLLAKALVDDYANQDISSFEEGGKVAPTRQMIAKLFRGDSADIIAVNKVLMRPPPDRTPGTSGILNPKGDYDFTEIMLGYMLCHEPLAKHLTEDVKRHIAEVLILEKGFRPKLKAPNSLVIIGETENHKLMREGARHLKYQWLLQNSPPGTFDQNKWREHAELLIELMNEAVRTGGFEYNSRPYFGYTITAMLVIHDCTAIDELRTASQYALDQLLRGMAWPVFDWRFSGPFRRQLGRAYDQNLKNHSGLGLLKTWDKRQLRDTLTLDEIPHGRHQAIIATVSDYQPSQRVFDALYKDGSAFVQLGHGRWAAPHNLSFGEGWLLSGGGSFQGKIKQVVPQPIMLLTENGPDSLHQIVHCPLPEKNLKVNHTGVFGPVAVSESPFLMPKQAVLRRRDDYWQLYRISDRPKIHVLHYQDDAMHALYVLPVPETRALELMQRIALSNPRLKPKGRLILHTGGKLYYDIKANKRQWVITKYEPRDSEPLEWVDRDYYEWPVEAAHDLPELNFD